MYICPKCNNQSETPINFCPMCGAGMVNTSVAPVQASCEQPSSTSTKVKGIVGMALSISGLVFSALGLLYSFVGAVNGGEVGIIFAIAFGIFSFPLSLVGLILSASARNAGDKTTFSKLGKIFGIIGLVSLGVSLFIGLIGLSNDSFYYDFANYYI